MTNKGFIQIPLLTTIVVSIIATSGAGAGIYIYQEKIGEMMLKVEAAEFQASLAEVAKQEAQDIAEEKEALAKQEIALRIQAEATRNEEEKAKVLELAKTHPMIQANVTGVLKFYIDPLPSYAAKNVSSSVDTIARSFSEWNPYGASIKRVYNRNNADLTIAWIKNYGSHTIGESIYRSHIKVGLGSNNCLGEWRAFDDATVVNILWHELGHSMGYGHSNDPNNIMYYQTATRYEVAIIETTMVVNSGI